MLLINVFFKKIIFMYFWSNPKNIYFISNYFEERYQASSTLKAHMYGMSHAELINNR